MKRLIVLLVIVQSVVTEARTNDEDQPGFRAAVKVHRGNLIHTRMLHGAPSKTDLDGVDHLVRQLETLAKDSGGTLSAVAKLNVYVADPSPKSVLRVRRRLLQAWKDHHRPALTLIPTPLLTRSAAVAADAVIVSQADSSHSKSGTRRAGWMPAGRDILYVSGRAASGELAEATTGTVQQLLDVIAHFGSRPADVVQIKVFLTPHSDWKLARERITRFFSPEQTPPIVFVEWTSQSRATEIELIAAAPDQAPSPSSVSFITPPGDKSSPVFSRVARVHSDQLIFIGGMVGTSAEEAQQEVKSLMNKLSQTATMAGSDLRHLVKATYYVSEDGPSAVLNQLRPKYYDPLRPPAASKVAVESIGIANRGLLLDMIAVPTPTAP